MLTTAILNVDVVCDVAMMSISNVLTTELRDLLYNYCIDNTRCYSFFIYPTSQISVCMIMRIFHGCEVRIEKSVRGPLFGITRLLTVIPSDGFFYPHQITMIDSFSCMPFDL